MTKLVKSKNMGGKEGCYDLCACGMWHNQGDKFFSFDTRFCSKKCMDKHDGSCGDPDCGSDFHMHH